MKQLPQYKYQDGQDGWQPLDTVPKDGTVFLVLVRNEKHFDHVEGEIHFTIGWWGKALLAVERWPYEKTSKPIYSQPRIVTDSVRVTPLMWAPLPAIPLHITKQHEHAWEAPAEDPSSDAGIMFSMLGQVCQCGAKRFFAGPAKGWKALTGYDRLTDATS